jgi:prepilin-type N-terminal cleavage/methylation domain-containing protein/prepilin-type processing-associated H-X9-DG protein
MNHNRFSLDARRGFTLIELLVVIAIIALLAAILFPVFGRARENARKSSCANNLKQIGIGLIQYQQDFDGYMPASQQTGDSGGLYSWPTIMFPYARSAQIFVCPSGERSAILPDAAKIPSPGTRRYCGVTDSAALPAPSFAYSGDGSTPLGVEKVRQLSYGRNLIPTGSWATGGFTGGDKNGFVTSGTTSSVNESEVEDSAGTIHIMDAWTGTDPASYNPCAGGNSIRGIQEEIRTDHYPNATASKVAGRHLDGFNAMYGDGHVKYLRWGSSRAADWSIQKD